MADFAKIFKLLRLEKNLSQQDLADRLKISKSSVSMYERGEREPDFEMLENIADLFNVDIDFLLGRTDKTTKVISDGDSSAHFDTTEYTPAELDRIKEFASFLKSNRKPDDEKGKNLA
jgi:transcriptional regulator with XRE-family HTH domain